MTARTMRHIATALLVLMPNLAQASFLPHDLIDSVANVISWFVLIVVPIGLIGLFWFVHIWPDTVAKRRKHPQRDAIHALCVLSLFFAGLLWPLAYLWAHTKPVFYRAAYGKDHSDEPIHPSDKEGTH